MKACCPLISKLLPVSLLVLAAVLAVGWKAEEKPESVFTSGTIDLGVVASDAQKSVDFYTNVVGLTEVEGFDVPAEFSADVGLTDSQPFHVHVLVANDDKAATKFKIMQFEGAQGEKIDNAYIHSSLGYRYITIWVDDVEAAVARAEAAGVKPLAKGVTTLPAGFPQDVALACIKDPDGNTVELVGPKK
ncbi:MAG: VOC family protein [Pirellulales bacterium]